MANRLYSGEFEHAAGIVLIPSREDFDNLWTFCADNHMAFTEDSYAGFFVIGFPDKQNFDRCAEFSRNNNVRAAFYVLTLEIF